MPAVRTHTFSAVVLATTFSVVSGYAAVPMHEVLLPNGQSAKVSDLQSLRWPHGNGRSAGPLVTRCHATHQDGRECRSWVHLPPGVDLDGRLGWRGYCQPCVDTFAALCRRRYRRLPELGREFFCPYCLHMRRDPEDRCPREADGRRRVKCLVCRKQDWTWKNSRQRQRAELRMVLR